MAIGSDMIHCTCLYRGNHYCCTWKGRKVPQERATRATQRSCTNSRAFAQSEAAVGTKLCYDTDSGRKISLFSRELAIVCHALINRPPCAGERSLVLVLPPDEGSKQQHRFRQDYYFLRLDNPTRSTTNAYYCENQTFHIHRTHVVQRKPKTPVKVRWKFFTRATEHD